jgi:hypothetical protein
MMAIEEAARMMRQHCINFNEEAAARARPCGGVQTQIINRPKALWLR